MLRERPYHSGRAYPEFWLSRKKRGGDISGRGGGRKKRKKSFLRREGKGSGGKKKPPTVQRKKRGKGKGKLIPPPSPARKRGWLKGVDFLLVWGEFVLKKKEFLFRGEGDRAVEKKKKVEVRFCLSKGGEGRSFSSQKGGNSSPL